MARNKKAILNQKGEELKLVKSEGLVFDEKLGIEGSLAELENDNTLQYKFFDEENEVSLKSSSEKINEALRMKATESPIYDDDGEEDGETDVQETPRPVGVRGLDEGTRKRLSQKDLRFFQRTGMLPK